MDASDPIWCKVKDWHIAKVLDHVPEQFKLFINENEAAKWERNAGAASSLGKIDALKGAVSSLAEYSEMKARYSKHTDACSSMMKIYSARNLEMLSQIEQDLVMTNPESSRSKALMDEVRKALENPIIEYSVLI